VINELEARAARVTEVRRVENLLHLPEAPAPSRTDTPALQMPVDARGFRTLRASGVQNGGVRTVRATARSRGPDFRIFRLRDPALADGRNPDVAEAVESLAASPVFVA
jgi:hypothetical protein